MSELRVLSVEGGFDLSLGDQVLMRHRPHAPAFFVGSGRPDVQMYRGNFDIRDRLDERIALRCAEISGPVVSLSGAAGQTPRLTFHIEGNTLAFQSVDPGVNRFWIRLITELEEQFWGGGEQMSYFNLAGRRFPLWTSEPGVGRDKSSLLTFQADRTAKSGGDYWNTNYPQPTYLSSRHYALHVDTTAYSCFDFRGDSFHELEVWEVPARIELFSAERFSTLVSQLSSRFGRPPRLPDWAFSGAILGLKSGGLKSGGLKDNLDSFARMDAMIGQGAVVTGLWCEDWAGLRITTFGKRLFWDWKASDSRYPELSSRIGELRMRGIRFLSYVNPYLAADGALFVEAQALGYLALRLGHPEHPAEPYLVDFGEFDAGVVDFTNPAASTWFAERVIGRELLDLGVSGWMADFGEYLPIDVRLADGTDGMIAHNAWPVLWAEVNARAVASRGMTGEAVFFMRAGFTGVSRSCPLLWAGDQSVDFSRHDGIGTVIRGALSSGLLGNAYHHSDLGGYTSLFGNVRTAELLMRWSELSAFSPVMRSHEGNRPDENLQLDGDAAVLAHFVHMTRVHAALAPYVASLCDQAVATGLPLQRPMFLDYEDDPACWEVETQYGYGRDLVVAPVIEAEARVWEVYLPAGTEWVHLWSADRMDGGQRVSVAAPLGEPPVFYRVDSRFAGLFAGLRELA